jgi:hypothetical protein
MTARLLPLSVLRIARLDAAYVARCASTPGMGKTPRPVAWSLEHRDGVAEPPKPGRYTDPCQRRAAVRLADELCSAAAAARAMGISERSVVRWRNGHVKKVAK